MQPFHILPDPFIPALHQHLVQWPMRTSGTNQDGTKHFVKPDLHATQAEKALWKLGDDADRYHRAKVLRPLPTSIGNAVATVYKDRYRPDNKKQDIDKASQRANQYITGIYNRHLLKKLSALCKNPLIYKTSELIIDDEYLQMTFGKAPELKDLNKHAKNAHENYLLYLLEHYELFAFVDGAELMPVKYQQGESDAKMMRFDDGSFQLKMPPSDNHQSDARHLHNFWNRTDNELRDYAFEVVRLVYQFMLRLMSVGESEYSPNQLLIRLYHVLVAIPNQMGIHEKYQSISLENFTHEHAEIGLCRLLCEKWWLRKLRRVHRQKHEEIAIACGVVHSGTQCYVSNATYQYYEQREAENRKVLNDMVAYNEDTGQEVPLPDLIAKSVSNPQIRRHELMTRMRGCEDYAKQHDQVGLFITVTAPSKYHPTTTKKMFGTKTTIANPKYNGATPDQTNRYLNNVWALVRSALDKFNIKPYGFRVVEPHEDETPHQHYMLFCLPEQQDKIIEIFKHYGLKEDGHEKGAKKHRVTIVQIDPKKGSATGYIAKYISKNIDGFQSDGTEIDGDNYGNQASIAAKRITAWRKCWGIRAFQPFGQPSVTVWRELRKYSSEDTLKQHKAKLDEQKQQPHSAHVVAYINQSRPAKKCHDDIIEKSRMWADTGHWDKFIETMGGVNIRSTNRPLWLLKADEPKQNRYKEAVPHKAIGVTSHTGRILTSDSTWTLHRKGESPVNTDAAKALRTLQSLSQRSSDAVALALADAHAQPWSAVNNCTDGAAAKQKEGNDQHKKPDNQSEQPTFTPLFDYPAPPQIQKAASTLQKISKQDQPIADLLLQKGINEALITGYIKRLHQGQVVRITGTLGYKLFDLPNGHQAISQTTMRDPGDDWFDDPDDYYNNTQTMTKEQIHALFDLNDQTDTENAA
jgi:hypothetical protein